MEKLLKELLEETKLLTVQAKAEAIRKINGEFLTSDLRRQMYEALDGSRTLPQISNDISCKINTLQIFVQQLADKDLVDFDIRGNARIVNKYYTNKATIYYCLHSCTSA